MVIKTAKASFEELFDSLINVSLLSESLRAFVSVTGSYWRDELHSLPDVNLVLSRKTMRKGKRASDRQTHRQTERRTGR